MIRTHVLATVVATLALTSACDTQRDRFRKEEQGRLEDQRVQMQLDRQAEPRPNEEQRTTTAKMQQELEDESTAALRNDVEKYAAKIHVDLDDSELKLRDLRNTTAGSTADLRTEYERFVDDVVARRNVVLADLVALGTATDETWEPLRTRIDQDLQALEMSTRAATFRARRVARAPGR